MTGDRARWVARLRPTVTSSVEALLEMPLGLDVWERHADILIVAAADEQLAEIERRRLADVERLYRVGQLQPPNQPPGNAKTGEV